MSEAGTNDRNGWCWPPPRQAEFVSAHETDGSGGPSEADAAGTLPVGLSWRQDLSSCFTFTSSALLQAADIGQHQQAMAQAAPSASIS